MLVTKEKLELTEAQRRTLLWRKSFRAVAYDINRAYHAVNDALGTLEDAICSEFDYDKMKVKDVDAYKDDVAKASREVRKAIIEMLIKFDRIPPYPSMERGYSEAVSKVYLSAHDDSVRAKFNF